jgi:hypothetical protein
LNLPWPDIAAPSCELLERHAGLYSELTGTPGLDVLRRHR